MTICEYAIAREFYQLLEDEDTRNLTERELDLLYRLQPIVRRLELAEARGARQEVAQ